MKKEDIKRMMDEELTKLASGEGDHSHLDEEFIAPIHAPKFVENKGKIDEESIALDSLLASVPKAQGYYLKLSKEVGTNNFEHKMKIDNWETWTDLENEISNIVKNKTIKAPTRWGSGHYRVIVWREGGLREARKPMDFYIDADEPELPSWHPSNQNSGPNFDPAAQISQLKEFMSLQDQLNPKVQPADVLKMQNESFMKGMELAQVNKNGETSGMAAVMQSMATMMTGMLSLVMAQITNKPVVPEPVNPSSILKDNIEMLGNLMGNKEKSKSIIDLVLELKTIGIDIGGGNKTTLADTIKELQAIGIKIGGTGNEPESLDKELSKVEKIVNMATGLASAVKGGDSASTVTDKLVEILAPKVPEMISNITGAVSNYSEASRARSAAMTGTMTGTMTGIKPSAGTSNQQKSTESGDDMSLFGFHPMFKELYTSISANDVNKFPYITNQIVGLLGEQMIKDIVTGTLTPDKLSAMIQQYGGSKFKSPEFSTKMLSYLTMYCEWCHVNFEVQNNAPTVPTPTVPAPYISTNIEQPAMQHATRPVAIISQNKPVTNEAAFTTRCDKCNDMVDWESYEQYASDTNHSCGNTLGQGKFCDGMLYPMDDNGTINELPIAAHE